MAEAIFNDRFILTSPQDVQHDGSMSGNGTLTSPLGVVPGYNETVLWSGVYSGSISDSNFITLSERPDNFETIEITNGPGYYSKYRYDGNSDTWSFMQTFANNGATTVYTNRYSVDKANKKVICKSSNSFNTYANGVSNWSNRTSMDVGETRLTKVVGINRKQ